MSEGNCFRPVRTLSLIHNSFLREGMRILIETEPSLELVASVSHTDAALRAFDETHPDLTVIDLDLPSGIEAIRRICQRSPGAWIIGLVTDELNLAVQEAITVGASVVLAKHLIAQELMPLILEVRQVRLQRDPAKRSVAVGDEGGGLI